MPLEPRRDLRRGACLKRHPGLWHLEFIPPAVIQVELAASAIRWRIMCLRCVATPALLKLSPQSARNAISPHNSGFAAQVLQDGDT